MFKKKNNIRLVDFLHEHCNKSKKGDAYIRFYRRLARLIEGYEQFVHRTIYTDSFSEEIVEEYIHYIRSLKPLKRGHDAYRQSTVRNFANKTVTVLNKARHKGYEVETDALQDLRLQDEDCAAIYLSIDEIKRINQLSLRGETAQIRDIFLIGCLTALRYSDYSRLAEENFHGGCITITTKKTNTKVTIPIHYIILDILNRNHGYDFLKYKASRQNFNKVIKNICKRAGINDKILVERIEGFRRIKKIYKKYELVSSHTARRSGATNMYLAGITPFRIMLITGHKTESAFYRYIRIQKEENARELQSHPFFSGTP